MSAKVFIAGAFSQVYVGTGSGSEVLTILTSTRTSGVRIHYDCPDAFLPPKNRSEQTEIAKFRAETSFMGLDDNILKLAMNNPLTQTNVDDPSVQATYTVLMVHPNPAAKSLLITGGSWTDNTIDSAFQKGDFTKCPIIFRNENANRFIQLFYLRPIAQLKTILGIRNPLQ